MNSGTIQPSNKQVYERQTMPFVLATTTYGFVTGSVTLVIAALVLAGCAGPETRPPEPAQPLPPTLVYFYPNQGQSTAQQGRDRYECYQWARKKTGFNPSLPQLAPHQRLEFVPGSAGQDAAITDRHEPVQGHAPETPEAVKRKQLDKRELQRLELQAMDYRRAMTACLEGRGYTVR